eukprot:EG_transcript_20668
MSTLLPGSNYPLSWGSPALPATSWNSFYAAAVLSSNTPMVGGSYSSPLYLGSHGLSSLADGFPGGVSYFAPLGTQLASGTKYLQPHSFASTFNTSGLSLPTLSPSPPSNGQLSSAASAAHSTPAGMTQPMDVGFDAESQWLEFFPEHGGLGVRARRPIPAGRYLAALRDYSPADGQPGRDFFVKVNDGAYRPGMSRAEYEARQGLCNCVGRGLAEGTFLVNVRDVAAGEPLSLFYGAQFWYEGRPFRNPPEGGPSR